MEIDTTPPSAPGAAGGSGNSSGGNGTNTQPPNSNSKTSRSPMQLEIPSTINNNIDNKNTSIMDIDSGLFLDRPKDAFRKSATSLSWQYDITQDTFPLTGANLSTSFTKKPWHILLRNIVPPTVMRIEGSDGIPCTRLKLDELFGKWLTFPETHVMLKNLLDDARCGRDLELKEKTKETILNVNDTIKKLKKQSGGKLRGLKSRTFIGPVTRFMDEIRSSTFCAEPPRSPHRTPVKPSTDIAESMDLSLDLGASVAMNGPSAEVVDLTSEFSKKLVSSPRTGETVAGSMNGVKYSDDVVMVDEKVIPAKKGSDAKLTEEKVQKDVPAGKIHALQVEELSKSTNAASVPGEKKYKNMLPNGAKPPRVAGPSPRNSAASSEGADLSARRSREAVKELPRFYFPAGRHVEEREKMEVERVKQFFAQRRKSKGCEGVTREEFSQIVAEVIGLPRFMASVVYDRIIHATVECKSEPSTSSPEVKSDEEHDKRYTWNPVILEPDNSIMLRESHFFDYYRSALRHRTKEERLFNVLLGDTSRNYLIDKDFEPLVKALLMYHPGLLFLKPTPEFQQRYCETVIQRIYYGCTRKHNGRLSLADIKRSRILDTLMNVDEDDDINSERRFFSYEHFYVLYCRFWELDSDHDLLIDRDDLMRYGTHALSYRIVDRIFGGFGRPIDCRNVEDNKMTYTDFVWFCLSEEDKTSDTAIDYWFRCVDLDGDGLITMYDMEYFYKEQLHRMECFESETVDIPDMFCQLLDMIKPCMKSPVVRRKDLKDSKLAANFFNTLFNVNKYFFIECRDPLTIRYEHATPELSDWDRFARREYQRLSNEEEVEEFETYEDLSPEAGPLMGEAPF